MNKRKRKFYLVLPLLALPFITLAFWAIGGGREKVEEKTATGLNLQLPDAKLKKEKNEDKLSFYKEADRDSLKRLEALRSDPNYKGTQQPDTGMNVLQMINKPNTSGYNPGEYKRIIQSPFSNTPDDNEQKIYKKINELNRQINMPGDKLSQNKSEQSNSNSNEQFSSQVDRLQNMMQVMNEKQVKDPEMEQLGGMLDKILDIQHPDRVKEQIKEKSIKNKQQVFSVQPSQKSDNISLMQSGRKDTITKKKSHNSFFDLNTSLSHEGSDDPAIEAVINETQTVVSGSTVKLRLTGDIYVNGILIPKNNFIYGTASLENERLSIHISGVRYQNNLLPVALEVYDLDGLAGIHIPGSISKDAVRQSAGERFQNIDITTVDPSLAGQMVNTGLQTAKNLLNKKVKLVKIILKAGYKVLLKDNNKQ